jgi:hypothetical protein
MSYIENKLMSEQYTLWPIKTSPPHLIWNNFSSKVIIIGKNPLRESFNAQTWYRNYMEKDPQLEKWANKRENSIKSDNA